ncbi:ABC transporter ATP-binding protein [Propionibacterium freudenreichii]|uniref:ABC-type molybdenum transport system, ATPase component/photorepair protein PhrA n=1 Tax=Propionibacterium freudenreichii TaxID=1744 RepID=A0A2C7AJ03_9ACTN|nr:ABC transporter ATP-binding protein [Propionibacterium freudenreichii]CUW16399.1 ABC transporter ATP-binding protein [Propionibacterium freudenreichii subsp. shermanii]SPB31039.1 putative ABC transporter ATP-binding protein YlmA [Propionibacterium freudenreichii subsp. shermanii]SPS09153.1 putative ABC transporter ATP-binding protein YlmA [Propionibacterium freudenreichii subsp. shermanii]
MVEVAKLSGVGVRRGKAKLLDDVNLTINEGDRWVVMGPNGAGKTTLLSLLSAQNHPSEGTVELLGERMGRVDVFELRPRIGLSSSSLAERIPRNETVENVVVSASYAVVGRWREQYDELDFQRAHELMRLFAVEGLAQRTFGTLSEGERKRVEIARALMTDPELLLLDEPGAGLDLGGREHLVATLSMLCQDPDSPAMVLVAHHVEQVPVGITHALLLDHGHVVAQGPINQVFTDEIMSAAFGLPLQINQLPDGRWAARARLNY